MTRVLIVALPDGARRAVQLLGGELVSAVTAQLQLAGQPSLIAGAHILRPSSEIPAHVERATVALSLRVGNFSRPWRAIVSRLSI